MADENVIVEINGDSSGFDKVVSGLSDKLSEQTSKIGSALADLGKKAVSGAISGLWDLGQAAIETGQAFEKSMSNVEALQLAAGATSDDIAMLKQVSEEYGASTQFTMAQCADALGYMALAGWDAEQSAAALPGVLSLAAAADMDLAKASDMVTDYMSAFSKSVSDYTGEALTAAEFSDKLAYAQANSNTNVEQLGEAYKNCAANMNAAGQQMDSVTAILGTLANQGLKGSESGTALSAVMRDINNSMQDGQISINGTSIAIADQNGNYRDLIDIMADVEAVTGSMSETERSAALSSVFTADSIKGMNLVLNSGVDSVRKLEAGLSDCAGTADEMAKTLNDTLKGDYTYLESAMDAVKNSVYEGIEPALRSLVQSTTNEAAPALNSLVKNLFALASGSADAGKNIQSVMTNLVSWLTKQISAFFPQIVKSASTMMTALLKGIAENSTNFHIIALEMGEELLAGIADILPELVYLGGNFIKSFGNSIRAKLPSILQTGSEIVQALSVAIRGNLSGLFDGIKQIFYDGLQILNTLGEFINLEEMAEIGGNLLKSILSSFQQNLPEIQKIAGLFLTKLGNFLLSQSRSLSHIGSEIFFSVIHGIQNLNYGKITDFIQKFFGNFSEKIQKNGSKLQNAGKNLILLLSSTISIASKTMLPIAGDILKTIANGFLSNLKIILPIAGEILSILISGIFSNLGEILTVAVAILEIIGNTILENSGMLSTTAIGILTTLCQFLLGNLVGLTNVALAIISDLCQNLLTGENLQLLLGCALEIVHNLATFLCENLGLILGAALEIVRFLADSLLSEDTMQLLLHVATQIITTLAQFLTENLGFLIGATFQIIEFLCEELLTEENLENLLALAGRILLAIVDGVAENIDDLLIAVDSILNKLVDELTKEENISRIFETGTKILKHLVEGLGKISGSILGFSLMLYQEISEKLENIDWMEIGKNILEGILSGLLGVDFDLGSFFGEFGDNFVTGIKAIFGIHSPSKLMRDQIGVNLARGIGVGFDQEIPAITQNAQDALSEFETLKIPEIPEISEILPESQEVQLKIETPKVPEITPELQELQLKPEISEIPEIAPELQELQLKLENPEILEHFSAMLSQIDFSRLQTQFDSAMQSLGFSAIAQPTQNYNYYNNYSENPVNQTERTPESSYGDIIIPVSIGGQQLETFVIKATQIANARSGGWSI